MPSDGVVEGFEGFDDGIHAPTRLRLCALLRPVDSADFATIAVTLEISDATLSKTIKALGELGYVTSTKSASPDHGDARRRTSVALTSDGRRAVDRHLAALRRLAASAAPASTPPE